MDLLRLFVGAGLVILLGRAASRRMGVRAGPGELALDGAIGLSLAVPLTFALLALRIPLPPRVIAGGEAFAAIFLFFAGRRRAVRADPATPGTDSPGLRRLSAGLVLAAFAVCFWKWARVPLWSWDHFAIWGMKARRLFPFSSLDLVTLQAPGFTVSNPHYPLGLPVAWRILALDEPAPRVFRAAHALFALGALLALRAGAKRATASAALGNALAGALCLSPLFWDSEALGLAEMPLAFLATSSVALLIGMRHSPERPAWAAGVTIGCVSWIKQEGMALTCLLLLFGAALVFVSRRAGRERRKALVSLFVPAVLLAGSGAAFWRVLLPRGFGFFVGNWKARGIARVHDPLPVLRALGRELFAGDWLGLWIAIGVVFAVALLRRRWISALLLSVVAVQIVGYACVYLFTYLDPAEHIASSFFRIVAATVPLALLGAGLLAERPVPNRDSSPRL